LEPGEIAFGMRDNLREFFHNSCKLAADCSAFTCAIECRQKAAAHAQTLEFSNHAPTSSEAKSADEINNMNDAIVGTDQTNA